MAAVRSKNIVLARMLLAAHANVAASDSSGRSGLHYAAEVVACHFLLSLWSCDECGACA